MGETLVFGMDDLNVHAKDRSFFDMINGTNALNIEEQIKIIKCPYEPKETAVKHMGYWEYLEHCNAIRKWEEEHGVKKVQEEKSFKVVKKQAKTVKITVAAAKKAVEHIGYVHKNDDGQITLLQKLNRYDRTTNAFVKTGINQYHYPLRDLASVENLQEYISSKNNDVYISVNSFWCTKRSVETLRRINALYVDIDKHDVNKVSKEEIDDLLKHYNENVWGKFLPEPSLIINSGRGVQVYWMIEDLPYQGLPLWSKVEQAIAKKMNQFNHAGFEVDFSCTDVTRVLRLAGTQNSKSRTQAKIIHKKGHKYRLDNLTKDYFQSLYISPARRKQLEEGKAVVKTKKQVEEFKLFKLLTTHSLHMTRLDDIIKLQEIRTAAGNDCVGVREFMCFLYRYYTCFAVSDLELALENTLDFNRKFITPLPEEEVIKETRSAEKGYLEWQEQYDEMLRGEVDGISTKNKNRKGYNYKTSTLVRRLKITDEESRQLKTLISANVKQERNTEAHRAKRRNSEGLTKKAQAKKDTTDTVQALKIKGLTQVEIAEQLGISERTVRRHWNV